MTDGEPLVSFTRGVSLCGVHVFVFPSRPFEITSQSKHLFQVSFKSFSNFHFSFPSFGGTLRPIPLPIHIRMVPGGVRGWLSVKVMKGKPS